MSLRETLKEIFSSWGKIIKLSRKPDKDEFLLMIKLSLLAIVIIGIIAYVIHIIFSMIKPV